ncbi:MAG TPA: sigma-54 dependent transcriptional regulator [Pyrinomonadaceae bacterium]|jgi:transcriptional regulator with GAF, ATPase, and Fis domain
MLPDISRDSDRVSTESRNTSTSHADAAPPTVYICESQPSDFQFIGRLISECGARARLLSIDADGDGKSPSQGEIALVRLAECPTRDAPALGLVRALKQAGARVVCYGARAQTWSLGKRCEALLAGALALLDSASAEFAGELKRALTRLLLTEANRRDDEAKLKREMSRLGIIGESAAMLSVFRWVERASALSDLPTLITGETGTGKELLVKAIFQLDEKRRHGPLVAVNCSAVSSGLAESELFGHRRGAFTGAERERKGLIRAAEGGVLFLDEVGDLDASLQAKLLRVLQENRVLGVGDDREVAVDVRVIAATNRNLEELVRQGKFRADLFHRLNILSVNLPPLRERPADIRPLVEHFIKKHHALNASHTSAVASEFIDALAQVELPGNARQLENLVRRALVNKDSDAPLNLCDLAPEFWQELSTQAKNPDASPQLETDQYDHTQQHSDAATHATDALPADLHAHLISVLSLNHWNLSDSLAHCEKLLVASALEHTHGNQAQTARLLGITPRSVYNKLRKHQLQ